MKNCNTQKNKKCLIALNGVLLISVLCVLGYRIYLSDQLSTAGAEYSKDLQRLESVQKENEQLVNVYYARTSLQSLETRALKSGYIAGNVEYITTPALASR